MVVEQTTIFGKRFFSRVIQLQVKVQCSLFVHRIAAMANHWVSVFGMWNLTSMMGYLRSSILKSKNSPIASPRPGKISSIAIAMSLIHCLRWTVSCISLACCSVEGLAVPWSVGVLLLGLSGRVVVECSRGLPPLLLSSSESHLDGIGSWYEEMDGGDLARRVVGPSDVDGRMSCPNPLVSTSVVAGWKSMSLLPVWSCGVDVEVGTDKVMGESFKRLIMDSGSNVPMVESMMR